MLEKRPPQRKEWSTLQEVMKCSTRGLYIFDLNIVSKSGIGGVKAASTWRTISVTLNAGYANGIMGLGTDPLLSFSVSHSRRHNKKSLYCLHFVCLKEPSWQAYYCSYRARTSGLKWFWFFLPYARYPGGLRTSIKRYTISPRPAFYHAYFIEPLFDLGLPDSSPSSSAKTPTGWVCLLARGL